MDQIMGALGSIAGIIGGALGALFGKIGPPTEWPTWAFAGLGVALLMGGVAYVWNRTGKGLLIVLTLLIVFVVFVIMNVQAG
jgi:hypothetical protein